ncbi:MAG: UvrD-helicase domain-containing protein, partial [Candidatus Aenigmatarchaeota archaeon]
LGEKEELLYLIKSLAAKGIFPTKEGWFKDSEKYLDGDFAEFRRIYREANEPQTGKRGVKQSELRKKLGGFDRKCYTDDSPTKEELRGGRGSKQIEEDYIQQAFRNKRKGLKRFVHDVFFSYIEYCLGRNYLNFGFLMMFAYALLYENHDLRERLNHRYVMVDEFQDTNEIQFKLTLLLAEKNNICVVGDWKQSIYSFQHASVENIERFRRRLEKYKEELNRDGERIKYPVDEVEEIELTRNYRSSQEILDFSEQSLKLKATRREKINPKKIAERIVSLKAEKEKENTEIKALVSKEEKEMVLTKIESIVDNEDYKIETEDGERCLSYGDVAVLTRTRNFGLELQEKAMRYGIPAAYEGGVELFKTNPAILLLAWLRIMDWKESKKGWSVVLERAGYKLDEVKKMVEDEEYPENMLDFRAELEGCENIAAVGRKVFDKYGINNAFSDKVIEVLQSTFQNSYMNKGQLIQFIEDNIESKQIYEVDSSREENVVTIQTIHGAKGLEYPVVFLSDINRSRFPSFRGGGNSIEYQDPIGLRQKKIYDDSKTPYVYDNWRTEILNKCLSGEYDEERRLMYVAMTRAENYLFFTAEEDRESEFFLNLDLKPERFESKPEMIGKKAEKGKKLEISESERKAPMKLSVQEILEEKGEGGRGIGTSLHRFAELYSQGENIKPRNRDEENVKQFIDDLEGKLMAEKTCLLPIDNGKRKILLKGRIDLVEIKEREVNIIDFKTYRDENLLENHNRQLSVYCHVLRNRFPEKEVEAFTFYSKEAELSKAEIIGLDELKKSIKI